MNYTILWTIWFIILVVRMTVNYIFYDHDENEYIKGMSNTRRIFGEPMIILIFTFYWNKNNFKDGKYNTVIKVMNVVHVSFIAYTLFILGAKAYRF